MSRSTRRTSFAPLSGPERISQHLAKARAAGPEEAVDAHSDAHCLLIPAPAELLTAYPVAPLVNHVRNNGSELVAEVLIDSPDCGGV